jgi:hypothetical protein
MVLKGKDDKNRFSEVGRKEMEMTASRLSEILLEEKKSHNLLRLYFCDGSGKTFGSSSSSSAGAGIFEAISGLSLCARVPGPGPDTHTCMRGERVAALGSLELLAMDVLDGTISANSPPDVGILSDNLSTVRCLRRLQEALLGESSLSDAIAYASRLAHYDVIHCQFFYLSQLSSKSKLLLQNLRFLYVPAHVYENHAGLVGQHQSDLLAKAGSRCRHLPRNSLVLPAFSPVMFPMFFWWKGFPLFSRTARRATRSAQASRLMLLHSCRPDAAFAHPLAHWPVRSLNVWKAMNGILHRWSIFEGKFQPVPIDLSHKGWSENGQRHTPAPGRCSLAEGCDDHPMDLLSLICWCEHPSLRRAAAYWVDNMIPEKWWDEVSAVKQWCDRNRKGTEDLMLVLRSFLPSSLADIVRVNLRLTNDQIAKQWHAWRDKYFNTMLATVEREFLQVRHKPAWSRQPPVALRRHSKPGPSAQ